MIPIDPQNMLITYWSCSGSTPSARSKRNSFPRGYWGTPESESPEYSIVRGIFLRQLIAHSLLFRNANCVLRAWTVVFNTTLNALPAYIHVNTTASWSLPWPQEKPITVTSRSSRFLYFKALSDRRWLTENTYDPLGLLSTAPSYFSSMNCYISLSTSKESYAVKVGTTRTGSVWSALTGIKALTNSKRAAKGIAGSWQ